MNDNRFPLRSSGSSLTSASGGASTPAAEPPSTSAAEPASASQSAVSSSFVLPHHRLVAYSVARELLLAVLACRIRDARLRDEAVRSAKSACLNCAEGAGRVTRADLKIPHIFDTDPPP